MKQPTKKQIAAAIDVLDRLWTPCYGVDQLEHVSLIAGKAHPPCYACMVAMIIESMGKEA